MDSHSRRWQGQTKKQEAEKTDRHVCEVRLICDFQDKQKQMASARLLYVHRRLARIMKERYKHVMGTGGDEEDCNGNNGHKKGIIKTYIYIG